MTRGTVRGMNHWNDGKFIGMSDSVPEPFPEKPGTELLWCTS